MGKILEKIIADRLIHVLEDRKLLNDNQAGFRSNRCTTDQILKLVQQASDQLHNKAGNTRTLVTFFDYEKAYDKVWRDGLIYKMQQLNLPSRFIRYVRHFLSGRKTRVEINGSRSDNFRLDEGLPQGSSISPYYSSMKLTWNLTQIEQLVSSLMTQPPGFEEATGS